MIERLWRKKKQKLLGLFPACWDIALDRYWEINVHFIYFKPYGLYFQKRQFQNPRWLIPLTGPLLTQILKLWEVNLKRITHKKGGTAHELIIHHFQRLQSSELAGWDYYFKMLSMKSVYIYLNGVCLECCKHYMLLTISRTYAMLPYITCLILNNRLTHLVCQHKGGFRS